jgi:hypothetical protein
MMMSLYSFYEVDPEGESSLPLRVIFDESAAGENPTFLAPPCPLPVAKLSIPGISLRCIKGSGAGAELDV